MANRLFNVAAVLSATATALLVAAWVAGGFTDSSHQFLSIGSAFHVSVERKDADGRAFFFNDASHGPYRGSIISVSAPGTLNGPKRSGFDFAGVYYRRFLWPDGSVLWTLAISLMYPLFASAILPSAWVVRRSRRTRRRFDVSGGAAAV